MDALQYKGIEEFRNGRKTKLKVLPSRTITIVEDEVRRLLHSSRDMMRQYFMDGRITSDPRKHAFISNDPSYREALGVMRAMVRLGYCYFGSKEDGAIKDGATLMGGKEPNPKQNAAWWFFELQKQVLREEGCKGDNVCEYCMAKYGRDNTTLPEKNAENATEPA